MFNRAYKQQTVLSYSSKRLGNLIYQATKCNLEQAIADEEQQPLINKQATSWDDVAFVTTIHIFARFNCIDALTYFLDQGYDPDMKEKIVKYINIIDKNGDRIPHLWSNFSDFTPLTYAAKWNQSESLNLLLDRGSDPNHINIKWNNFTALMFAADNNYLDIANSLLLAGANITYIDLFGRNASQIALLRNNTELFDLIESFL